MKAQGIEKTAKIFNETINKDVSLSYKNELGEIITKTGKGVHLSRQPTPKWTFIFEEE